MVKEKLHLKITFKKKKSVISVNQQQGAIVTKKRGDKCLSVSFTSISRPVPEDLQWTLIIIQNHLLARLIILLQIKGDKHQINSKFIHISCSCAYYWTY